jgi:hypothetical protein
MGISVLPMRSQSFFCFFHACSHDSNHPSLGVVSLTDDKLYKERSPSRLPLSG